MEFLHNCSFCGWRRAGATPVMLSPACERCGCALDASRAAEDVAARAALFAVPAQALVALRWLALLLAALALYAAAKVGWGVGGASGGMVALGVGGFLMLPFVPERVR